MAFPHLESELERLYGFPAFRGLQRAVIEHFLGGGSALVLMATGEGKSLCYQLPAFVGDGLTIVVSPLIALMDDQVAALAARGLPATCVHSLLERGERERRLAAALRGEIRLLYVTPERFRVPGFLDRLAAVKVARFAVDEAHCVSHWGHDFRPDYRKLGAVRRALGNPPCLALTATATPAVQADIRDALGLEDAERFCTGIARDNLFLSVAHCQTDDDKVARLREVLQRTGGPAIVYCALIQDLTRLETTLQRDGFRPLVYHGDLSAHERRTQQRAFQERNDALILATNAFGMGVDKADIRAIVHWQIPRTLEAYYQEVGRAGRDGQGAFCELLYREEDLVIQRNFLEWANPSADFARQIAQHLEGLGDRVHALDLDALRDTFLTKQRHDGRVETVLRLLRTGGCITGEIGRDLEFVRAPTDAELSDWLPDDKRQRDLTGLLSMVRYASEAECRKRTIHAHFGFDDLATGGCGACDVCVATAAWQDAHLPAARALRSAGEDDATANGGDAAPVRRGDWLETRRHGLCCVQRVHRRGNRWRVDVELARDLSSRGFDLKPGEWRLVERD
ncbi:MAG: RecQ family ATP-dependent DNA helicase [Planctomycetes bacterium]|nr:RecQ family ATP-dependent DNA helicase [Planctomycetota bacterium]